MIWVMAALMVAVLAAALAAPMLRGRPAQATQPAPAHDIEVYRDQLRGIERDAARGQIAPDEAQRLRAEIARRMLEADRAASRAPARALGTPPPLLAQGVGALALALMLAAGLVTYARYGAPGAPDLPLAARLAEAQALYDARPSQAEAAAAARPRLPPPAVPEPEIATLMQELRDKVAAAPDVEGLALLADYEFRLGNLDDAIAAQAALIDMRGAAASSVERVQLAEMMIVAAGDVVTPEAEAQLAAALAADPRNPVARFYQGLLFAQNGREDRTFPIWRGLLEGTPPDAPWNARIRRDITLLAWLAGEPDYQPPAVGAPLRGPDAAAMQAADDLSDADRAAMIDQMVQGLEDRLAREGGSAAEWAQLLGALAVQGRTDHARAILAEARDVFAADPAALAIIDAAAARAGLE
ncbi:MAG: c-type cytochrome biogenesis protein CcmI [Paracoccus sp. (in: a-proteobacteria)]|nr:c-type cytochrome biogenesis protein CcmI [Paracoccus sp. (in: a-proteobacteria)]